VKTPLSAAVFLTGRSGRNLRLPIFVGVLLGFCLRGCDSDAPHGVTTDESALQKLLEHYDEQFDSGASMLWQKFSSPGSHTLFETGDLVHTTRESLIHALAYWKTEDDPAVVLRLRFLHDGRDFASMGIRSIQDGPRVLSKFYPIENAGNWHPSLDRPENGLFHA
jgi:hypothetical protein